VPWRNPHAPPAQAPVNVPAVMESDFLLMKTLPLRNDRGQIAHVPAVVAAVNALPVKVVDSRALLLPRPNPLPGPAGGYTSRAARGPTSKRTRPGRLSANSTSPGGGKAPRVAKRPTG
jgi:hypothetical protein